MATCPNGHKVRDNAVFCGACGIDLRTTCINGHINKPGLKFCESCGTAIPVAGLATSPDNDPEFEGAPTTTTPATPSEPLVPIPEVHDEAPTIDLNKISDQRSAPAPSTVESAPSSKPKFSDVQSAGHASSTSADKSDDDSSTAGIEVTNNRNGRTKKPLLVALGAIILVIGIAAVASGLSSHHPPTTSSSSSSTSIQPNNTTSAQILWNSPTEIDPGNFLESVSCPSSSFCAAIDGNGNAFIYDGTSWSSAQYVNPSNWIDSVSCPSSSFCVAAFPDGNAVTFDGTSWSGAQTIDQDGLSSVSCPSLSCPLTQSQQAHERTLQQGEVRAPVEGQAM
jgi:hypothetical protein